MSQSLDKDGVNLIITQESKKDSWPESLDKECVWKVSTDWFV